jgi:DNA-binding MarR family transcriptional regulator
VNPTAAPKPAATAARTTAVQNVAEHLLPRASLITRLLIRRGTGGISRAEAGILSNLEHEPRRVTDLAASQALAQPTVTQLVGRLEERGLVARGRHPGDGRVVLVSLTTAGQEALEALRAEYRTVLRDHLAGRSDAEVQALAAATDALQDLIASLQDEGIA